MKELRLTFKSAGRRVTTITGQITRIRREIELPLTLRHRSKSLRVYALPTLALPCIIGVDFLLLFGIGVNFATKRWYFSDNPTTEYEFDASLGDPSFHVNASDSENIELRETAAKTGKALPPADRPPTPVQTTLSPRVENPRKRTRIRASRKNPPICVVA